MGSDNVIKFGKAKKALNRQAKEKKAAENRVKFGRSKAQKQLEYKRAIKQSDDLDGHKREE